MYALEDSLGVDKRASRPNRFLDWDFMESNARLTSVLLVREVLDKNLDVCNIIYWLDLRII